METTDILESTMEITGETTPAFDEILTPGALAFVEKLNITFGKRRKELLINRINRQKDIDAGIFPDFLSETEHIRSGEWSVSPVENDLQDRRVEITGPVERKMIINAIYNPYLAFGKATLLIREGTFCFFKSSSGME